MTVLSREKDSFDFWYRTVQPLVPTPRTHIIKTDLDFAPLMDGATPDGFEAFCQRIAFAARKVRYPAFLRTGHTSGKHNWCSTCYLDAEAEIPSHVSALVEESYLADFFGLPTDVWVVREFVPGPVAFTAFNGLPIRKERRVFVNAGKVRCHHPYWPADAIKRASCPDWVEKLAALNAIADEDLAEILTLSATVAQALPGAWSLDWMLCHEAPRWRLIDAALAEHSYHFEGCQEP